MRLWKRIIVYFLLLITVAFISGYVYFFHLGGLESALNNLVAGMLGEDSPVLVRVGEVRGNLFSGVMMEDIFVTYVDSGSTFQVVHIPRLVADYSLSNLWNRRYILDYLYIDSAEIAIVVDSKGSLLVPRMNREEKKSRPPDFLIEDLYLDNWFVKVIAPDDTIEIRNLVVSGAAQSEDGMYTVAVKQIGFGSNIEDINVAATTGKLTVSEQELLFQDFTIVSSETRLKASGHIDLNEASGRIDFAVDQIDLAAVARHIGPRLKGVVDLNGSVTFGRDGIDGSVVIGGDFLIASLENLFVEFAYADRHLVFDTLYGTILGNCSIDGSGHIDFTGKPENYQLIADIRNFNLKNLISHAFESDLTGRIDLKGRSFRKSDMTMTIDAELVESSFHEYPVQHADGTMLITIDSIQFIEPFFVDYFENRFSAGGTIEYSGDIDLTVDVELENLDRYRGKLFIDQPGGRGFAHGRLSGKTADPDLQGWFRSDSLWLYGLYSDSAIAVFDIDRFLNARQGSVETRVFSGAAWQVPYDSAYARITLDSTIASLDTVSIGSEFASAVAGGRLDYGSYPRQLTLDTLRLAILEREFFNRLPLEIGIDSFGFGLQQLSVGNETADLKVLGRVDFDESMGLTLSIKHVPIAPWLRLFDMEISADGYVSCEADLRGEFASPHFDLRGGIDSLTYRDLVLGDLTLMARYGDQRLNIDSLFVDAHPGSYTAQGYLNLDLAFTAGSLDRVPDRPFDLSIKAADQRFDLVTLFMPSVEELDGDFIADVRLSGTPSKPHLEGVAVLRNGAMKYFDLADTLFTDSAVVTMRDNRIIIDNVTAYVKNKRKNNRKSYALIDGVITVKSFDNFHYDLDVTLPKEFPFEYDLDDIRGVVEGDIQVFGDSPPLVTGDLTVISTMYRVNFASEDEGSPIMTAFSGENTWDLNINVDILSNYWIKNDDIDAEFGGFVNLIRENGRYRFIGEMDILRGRGFLFDKTFRIEPPSRVIFEDTEYPNPRLDITAYTRIAGVRFEEEERRDYTELGIHVSGTLENPEFNTAAGDTTFTREDILPLIVANYYGGQNGSSGLFQERVTQLVSSQISRIGSKQLSQLGVETFEIDPAYGGSNDLSDTRVTLGFYTGSSLYIYGRSTLSGQSGQALGFEYRFSRSLRLEGRRDEEELYHLNFDLRWEF